MPKSLGAVSGLVLLALLAGCVGIAAPAASPSPSAFPEAPRVMTSTSTVVPPTATATTYPCPDGLSHLQGQPWVCAAQLEALPHATPVPLPPDYTALPPLAKLVISSGYFADAVVHIPPLLFEDPPPRKYDLTSQLEGMCGLDCVKRHLVGRSGSLTLTLIRYKSPADAGVALAHSWQQFSPGLAAYDIYDQYTGEQDDLWAAQSGTTLAFALTDGPIFINLGQTVVLVPGAHDFDAPWYMGLLSCLGRLQLQLLIEASLGASPSILEEPPRCMMWV
jgi:hypothetical protein